MKWGRSKLAPACHRNTAVPTAPAAELGGPAGFRDPPAAAGEDEAANDVIINGAENRICDPARRARTIERPGFALLLGELDDFRMPFGGPGANRHPRPIGPYRVEVRPKAIAEYETEHADGDRPQHRDRDGPVSTRAAPQNRN